MIQTVVFFSYIIHDSGTNPRVWIVVLVPISDTPPFCDTRDGRERTAKHNSVAAVKEIFRVPKVK